MFILNVVILYMPTSANGILVALQRDAKVLLQAALSLLARACSNGTRKSGTAYGYVSYMAVSR